MQAHIKQVLEEACAKFHNAKLREKCVVVVDQNADYIVNAIVKDISPKKICIVLGFCFGNEVGSSQSIDTLSPAIEAKYAATPQCVLCELVMTRLETELKNKKTQDEIRESVQNICSKLPKSVSSNCKQFVQTYADLIISLVSTVPPKELCGEINLCLTHQTKDVAKG